MKKGMFGCSFGVRFWSKIGVIALCAGAAACAGRTTQVEKDEPAPAAESKDAIAEGKKTAEIARKNTEASAEYHFALAQAYVVEGNPDRAIEEYKLTLMFDPNSSLVYARLATEYVKKGLLSAAMEACKEALQRDSNFVDARMMLAGLYSTSHETEAALAEYDRVLKSNPRHEEAIVYKSQVLLEAGRGEEAVRFLRKFVKGNSESALGWYYLGRAEQNGNHFNEAVTAYRKTLELRPGFAQAALALGFLYEDRRMNAEAVAIYRGLYDESQDLSAANRLATIYLKLEKYKDAIPYLQAIEAADPEDLNVRVKLGLIEMELKNYSRAIEIFTAILQKNPESDRIHYYLGSVYEETKQFDKAIQELKRIRPESKLYVDAALHVGYLLKQGSQIADAKNFIRDAIAKSPNTASFYVFDASLEEETKNVEGAISILEAAHKKFPEDEKILYYLGSLHDRQGDVDKGLVYMEAIIKINSENVDALNYIGYTWTLKGIRLNDAEKLLVRALRLKPENGYVQDSWGWHLFVRGRVSEAVVELEKAARLKPNEPTILEHLGDAYLRKNLREKAMMKYSDAVRYAEDDASKRKIEMKLQNLQQELAGGASPRPSDRVPAAE